MTRRYIIYIYNNKYSGYYTGQILMSTDGKIYPGIVAIKDSQKIKLYPSLAACKTAISDSLLPVCPDVCRFDVIEKFSDTLTYKVKYKNYNIESEYTY